MSFLMKDPQMCGGNQHCSCGGLKNVQIATEGGMNVSIVNAYAYANVKYQMGVSAMAAWCPQCGTMYHPDSI